MMLMIVCTGRWLKRNPKNKVSCNIATELTYALEAETFIKDILSTVDKLRERILKADHGSIDCNGKPLATMKHPNGSSTVGYCESTEFSSDGREDGVSEGVTEEKNVHGTS